MNPEPDFRIDAVDWTKEAPDLSKLADVDITKVQEFQQKVSKIFCDIAINTWRAQRKVKDRASGEVKPENRAIHRSLMAIFDSLAEVGLQVRDREGEPYDFGLPEKVVAAEKRGGLSREVVVETIRPSIFFANQLARAGEIVIAVPEDPAPAASESANSERRLTAPAGAPADSVPEAIQKPA